MADQFTKAELEQAVEDTVTRLIENYLSWVNDYLTIEKFAEDHLMDVDRARVQIDLGKKLHEARLKRSE